MKGPNEGLRMRTAHTTHSTHSTHSPISYRENPKLSVLRRNRNPKANISFRGNLEIYSKMLSKAEATRFETSIKLTLKDFSKTVLRL